MATSVCSNALCGGLVFLAPRCVRKAMSDRDEEREERIKMNVHPDTL